ncbi:Beta-1-Syntrophin [Manis pentadactyla]|nr:Beta-1-Syntrophin [Manis pentadactyla]
MEAKLLPVPLQVWESGGWAQPTGCPSGRATATVPHGSPAIAPRKEGFLEPSWGSVTCVRPQRGTSQSSEVLQNQKDKALCITHKTEESRRHNLEVFKSKDNGTFQNLPYRSSTWYRKFHERPQFSTRQPSERPDKDERPCGTNKKLQYEAGTPVCGLRNEQLLGGVAPFEKGYPSGEFESVHQYRFNRRGTFRLHIFGVKPYALHSRRLNIRPTKIWLHAERRVSQFSKTRGAQLKGGRGLSSE